jgi:mycothiol synthase
LDGRVERHPYRDEDLPRLEAAMRAWIAERGRCGYDHSGVLAHRIYENLRGRRPIGDLVHVWTEGSGVVGISICLRFGGAFDVFLAPGLWGSGDELTVLADAADTTARFSDEEFVVTDVFGCDRARQEALARLGFERYRIWDHVRERRLDRPCETSTMDPRAGASDALDGFMVRSATVDDAEQLAEARNASFDEDWTGDRYRDEVMGKPGYDPDREIVAVAPDGRVAAYTVYWEDRENRIGLFEPVGTHRDFRRRGLARAVMVEAMVRMRAAGLVSVSVNHNADNAGALALYRSLGFLRTDLTYGYRRPRR